MDQLDEIIITSLGRSKHLAKFKNDVINIYFLSINIGPVHLISFSTEFYYFVEYGFSQMAHQYHWLENDLKEANKPENRANQPCNGFDLIKRLKSLISIINRDYYNGT